MVKEEDGYFWYVVSAIKKKIGKAAEYLGSWRASSKISGLEEQVGELEEKLIVAKTLKDKRTRYARNLGKVVRKEKEELEAVLAEKEGLKEQVEGLIEEKSKLKNEFAGLEERVENAEQEVAKKEDALSMEKRLRAAQGNITKMLYSRMIMSERLVIEGVKGPVMFLDNNLRVVAVNKTFTEEFGYKLSDLRDYLDTLPEGEEVEYNSKKVSTRNIVRNMHNLEKLNVLNQFFYPKARNEHHYEICLYIKPGKKKKRWFGGEAEQKDVMCMAYVRVAVHDGRFIGASLEMKKMSRSEIKSTSVNYILSKDAFITVDEHVDAAKAERYVNELAAAYTTDPSPIKKEEGSSRKVVLDFINTKMIEPEASEIFSNMCQYSLATRGRIKIKLANLNVDLRNQLLDAGIGADIVHGRIREDIEYKAESDTPPLLETS
ncbi:hypothetical protein GOV06_02920 [Candidatus Woesearchaeota archaeon]|nr:hypothetical protein [Candidatus Woesearchaeota archaeon]